MDDLRSLQGVGQLLSQKFEQTRHKLKWRPPRRSSDPSSISSPTPMTDYFDPQIADLLTNNIHNAYYKILPSQPYSLTKSHSDYARDVAVDPSDMLFLSDDDVDDCDRDHGHDNDNDNDDDDEFTIETLDTDFVELKLPEIVDSTTTATNDAHDDRDTTAECGSSFAPLHIEPSFSSGIDCHNVSLFIAMNDCDDMQSSNDTAYASCYAIGNHHRENDDDDDDDDDIELCNLSTDYIENRSPKQKHVFNNIGNGASGIVRKFFHYKSCKMVAVKQCRSKQKHEIAAFVKEGRLYREFAREPSIVSMLEFGHDVNDGELCLMLEYMDLGSSDALRIHEIPAVQQRESIVGHIMQNVVHALHALHSKLYVHNDVKPGNILCNKYGDVKLSDFGCVSQLRHSHEYLCVNNGTQRYQSPEKISQCTKFNPKSDIWSLGVTCYELLFGVDESEQQHDLSYINRFKHKQNALSPATHQLSAECCDFINECLTFDERKRPTIEALLTHPWFAQVLQSTTLQQRWPWRQQIDMMQGSAKTTTTTTAARKSTSDNVDLLFMISALIIYYSRQNMKLTLTALRPQRSIADLTDDERIANIAYYALCNKATVVERIRVTVAYVKLQLNKREVSRIDS
eukprot:CAMPEP_0202686792 /NCGR_PEP_ID=MMETSP1385-20130828/2562_1 /ASSEMBLY_ACC=CAM_ASM_000861 /TAXON_ID=933848 /ORGANISM="Elphidium margaritaceum" /LENGTH=625 /DNA_ID=CAMNT_0049341449 /DNA_START=34 /DNA_END=1911 /DNA_ORIENTATION=+